MYNTVGSKRSLLGESDPFHENQNSKLLNVEEFLGKSSVARKIREEIKLFASVEEPVVITGETGTGKEVIARQVHSQSARAQNNFIAVNCGSFNPQLITDDFFGHNKGAFTGAYGLRQGIFEIARGGTLFLDEIAELPFDFQVLLLRILENKKVIRLGSTREIDVDVRIVVASNKCLHKLISENKFRDDLFYRIEVCHISVPPLRKRAEDMKLLADYFLHKYALVYGFQTVPELTPEALKVFNSYDWPGNTRQLINVLKRILIYLKGRKEDELKISLPDLRDFPYPNHDRLSTLAELKADYRKEEILNALKCTSGNLKEAAELTKISYSYLRNLIVRYRLRDELNQIRQKVMNTKDE